MNELIEIPISSLETDSYKEYLDGLSPRIKSRILKQNTGLRTGIGSLAPLTCHGPAKCKIIERCPIPERGKGRVEFGDMDDYPINEPCVVENLFMMSRTNEIMDYLKISPEDPIESAIAYEIALIDLYKNRCQIFLSKDEMSNFMIVDVTGFDDHGHAATNTKLNPLIEMMDKLEKRREKWLDKLDETRKAKNRINSKKQNHDSKLLTEVENLRKAMSAALKSDTTTNNDNDFKLGD